MEESYPLLPATSPPSLPASPPPPPSPFTDDYPVRLDIAYPERGNRFMILVRWFLAIPHVFGLAVASIPFIVLSILNWAPVALIAYFAFDIDPFELSSSPIPIPTIPIWAIVILTTAAFPEWLFGYFVWFQRYAQNVGAYVLFHNRYPAFGGGEGEYEPVFLEIPRQESYSRWLPFVKWLLVIPHTIVLTLLSIGVMVAYIGTWWAVLATGRYPRNLFEFQVAVTQWSVRVYAYQQLMVDRYPPFSFGRRVSTAVVVWCVVLGCLLMLALVTLAFLVVLAAMANRPPGPGA